MLLCIEVFVKDFLEAPLNEVLQEKADAFVRVCLIIKEEETLLQ